MRFDVDGMVGAVRKAQAGIHGSSGPELAEALLPALNAPYFLLDGHGPNFEDYLAAFVGAALPSLGDFSTPDAFDAWSKAQSPLVIQGELSIAGVRYCLGCSRATGRPLLLRLPRVEDLWRPTVSEGQERFWRALEKADDVLRPSPEDMKGLQSAALALHFVAASDCTNDFNHFLAHLEAPLPALRVFDTRDEAESWLKQHPRPPHGARVKVGEEVRTVGYQRERNQRTLVRFPREEQLST